MWQKRDKLSLSDNGTTDAASASGCDSTVKT